MKKILTSVICIALAATILPSCVSKKKLYAARAEARDLRAENMRKDEQLRMDQDSIDKLRSNVNALGDVYQSTNSELNMTKEQVAAQRERMRQLQAYIDQQQKATENLRKKIADALVGFNTSDLTVTVKNGRVYVSMQESLLFPSGSAVVNPRGKEALAKVAGVLNTSSDINVDVEGHTDSIAIHNKTYADNWALSVARATSIAHVLIDDYSVAPNRVIASGRSKYDPVASNNTPGGRALNRRTEIILEPKLDELMHIMAPATATATAK